MEAPPNPHQCNPPKVPHVWHIESGTERCAFCGIKWRDWANGVMSGGFSTKTKTKKDWLAHPDDVGRQGSFV